MRALSFSSKYLFLISTCLLIVLFLASCEDVFEQQQHPSKTDQTTPELKFELSDCISISPSKMNVLFIGVDNPIVIDAPGVDPESLKISISGGGGTIKKGRNNLYLINVTKPAPFGQECEIKISAPGIETIEKFRVKLISDPVAMISASKGGSIGVGEFKA